MNKIYTEADISKNMSRTPEGYLLCKNVPLARTGDMIYTESDRLFDTKGTPLPAKNGEISVYKSPEVLFSPAAISSFEGKPLVIGHKMIGPDNWNKNVVGTAINVRRGTDLLSNNLIADLLITDRAAQDSVRKGSLREISLGYEAQYESDGPGRAHQLSIIGNHIAIVPRGRAGSFCRIYDSITDTITGNMRGMLMNFTDHLKKAFGQAVDSSFSGLNLTVPTVGDSQQDLPDKGAKSAPVSDNLPEPKIGLADGAKPEPAGTSGGNTNDALSPQTIGGDAVPPNPMQATAQGPTQQQAQAAALVPMLSSIDQKLDKLLAALSQKAQPSPTPAQSPAAPTQPMIKRYSIDPTKNMYM